MTTEQIEQATLRDQIEAAFDEVGASDEPAEETPAEEAPEAPEEVAESPEEDATPAEEAPAEDEIEHPSTWKKEHWDDFKALPTQVKKYIREREAQAASGISRYKQGADQWSRLEQILEPYRQTLDQYNINPADYIGRLSQAHLVLSSGTPEQKAAVFEQLKQQYGIDSQYQPDAYSSALQARLEQAERLAAQAVWSQRTRDEADVHRTVAEFEARGLPYYEQLKPDMARLLQSGQVGTLDEAYEMAKGQFMSVAEKMAQDRVAAAEKQRAEAVAAAKKKAGLSGGAPAAEYTPSNEPTDLRATIERAFARVK